MNLDHWNRRKLILNGSLKATIFQRIPFVVLQLSVVIGSPWKHLVEVLDMLRPFAGV